MYKQKKEVVLFGINPNLEPLKEYVPELKIRMNKGKIFNIKPIKNGYDAYEVLTRIYPRGIVQEHVIVLLLNRANKVIGFYRHTIGSTTSTMIDVTLIVNIALKSLAKAVIISHNHPSGNTYPSDADKQITKKLHEALDMVGIYLLDHVIYSEETYYSFNDEGILNGLPNTTPMITIQNVLAEYQNIPQEMLPTALQQTEFEFIYENLDLYHEDDTIKQYIDTFIEKLNQVVAKEHIEIENQEPQKSKKKEVKNTKTEAKTYSKPKAEPKQKVEPKVPEITPDDVDFISPEVRFIKRYVALNGKMKSKSQIKSFINSLQRAIIEKRIRKTSGYADIIEKIQSQLIECYNKMAEMVSIDIHEKTLEKYTEIAKSEQVSAIVKFVKQYISIHGKSDVKAKAKTLYKRYEKALNNADLDTNDVRYKEVHAISQSLIAYLQDRTETIEIKETELHGLMGLAGISVKGLNGLEATPTKCISSSDLANMEFETIGLQGKYRKLIGDPSRGFMAMVYGLPKSGKSTLSIDFARHLAQNHGRVLYAALEEGFGYTLKEKFERLNAIHPNLIIAEKLPENLSSFDFVFIDSVSKAGMTIDQLVRLHKQYPRTAFVFIFHSTKDGNFRGGQQFAHEVDCIIDVADGVAKGNGRFGVGGEINVFND